MQVLSDGMPLTTGEVYSILRRRRDERNAAQHPPFCLQQQQASPQSRNSAAPSLVFSGVSGGARTTLESQAAASASLAVLLSEVKLLQYLAHGDGGDCAAAIREAHGPSSVYNAPPRAQSENEEDEDSWGAERRQRLRAAPAGTPEHVAVVRELLDHYEGEGRRTEERWARQLRDIARRHRAGGGGSAPAIKREKLDDDGDASASVDVVPLFALPTPLCPVREAAPGRVGSSLTGAELMRMVDHRPRSALLVHQLLDLYDGRPDDAASEEADALVGEIMEVFGGSAK